MKTPLNVPFGEHLTAKRLGARWDAANKTWYVPDGIDLTPFLKWVPNMPKMSKKVRKALKMDTGKNQGEFRE